MEFSNKIILVIKSIFFLPETSNNSPEGSWISRAHFRRIAFGQPNSGRMNDIGSHQESLWRYSPIPGDRDPGYFEHHCSSLDAHDGNHSSEEELEEINKLPEEQFVGPEEHASDSEVDATGFDPSCSVSSSDEACSYSGTPGCSSSSISKLKSPSSDEENQMSFSDSEGVTGVAEDRPAADICLIGQEEEESGSDVLAGPPVQFSTAPPTGVHVKKPRRSTSPPSIVESTIDNHPDCDNSVQKEIASLMESKLLSPAHHSQHHSQLSPTCSRTSELRKEKRGLVSPGKRLRPSRAHHLQRPCLDFEKMQQVNTLCHDFIR